MQKISIREFAVAVLLLGMSLLCVLPVSAADNMSMSAPEALTIIADFMQAVSSLHAEFEQSVKAADTTEVIETEVGELWLQ